MTTIATSPSSVAITSGTVTNDIGICYFDPISESLLEINSLPNHFLSVEPFSTVLKKYYLVIEPGVSVNYVRIKPVVDASLEDAFSIKVMITDEKPSVYIFDDFPNFNSFRVDNPSDGIFIPIWILLRSKVSINSVNRIQLEIEYE